MVSRIYTARPAGHKVIKAVIMSVEEKLLVLYIDGQARFSVLLCFIFRHDGMYFVFKYTRMDSSYNECCLIWEPFDIQGLGLFLF